MRRVDVYLAVAAAAFVAGSTALVDLARLGAGMALLTVAVFAVLLAVLAAGDTPAADIDLEEDPDGRP
jgi:hypothetical protein